MVQKIIEFDVALKSTERQWVQKVPEVYTNDLGSVTIQFRITDCTELTGSTAIVLLKMRDGSFFQGPSQDVGRTLNVFSYDLKENEGNHDGLAEIQLVVTIAGKVFGTQKYNFKVVSGLDSEIAREIMIYDWSTLTAEARAYIDQFTADELLRDAEFDNAQFDRNAAFVADQAGRVTAFNAAEAARAAGYDADHSIAGTDHTTALSDHSIAGTDHTTALSYHSIAGTDHTTALSDHSIAGTDHATALSDHSIAGTDHAVLGGYNGRLTDVETYTSFDATNKVLNGDFSNETNGWFLSSGFKIENGELKSMAKTPYLNAEQNRAFIDAHKYYFKVSVKNTSAVQCICDIAYVDGSAMTFPANSNVYVSKSIVFTNSGNVNRNISLLYLVTPTGDGLPRYADNVTLIDLTSAFGVGKEPTLAEMDRLIARFPNSWFDGTKPIQTIETLYQEKANKTQEAWITPTLLNGWANYGAPLDTSGYIKDTVGFVHLKGVIVNGTLTPGTILFNLPIGYRPSATKLFVINSNDTVGRIHVEPDGRVSVQKATTGFIQLDGLIFRAEQ